MTNSKPPFSSWWRPPDAWWLALTLCTAAGGCSDVKPVKLNPQQASEKAIELYDANSDGRLADDELAKVPALAVAARRVDQNGDGITAAEIADRMNAYQSDFVAASALVTRQNRPLVGAEVVFEPESFMGDGYETYRGTTDESGMAPLDTEEHPPGLPPGFYRVLIKLPDGGTETLGWEIADDAARPEFHLRG